MENTEQPTSDHALALKRIKRRRDFQAHLVTYIVINAAVWIVWAATGGGYLWPAWVSGGWAIGLALNIWGVYLRRPITDDQVQRELDRDRRSGEAI